ncbi:hypothetical protein LTR92_005688 [Exophiala xenobiotica]|nr:hypothetical protein LTR92_005688 [Exophiala xenobiotica]KAK5557368.1 hypothetical protein LTR46_004394 [Exophiala xenobiotica]
MPVPPTNLQLRFPTAPFMVNHGSTQVANVLPSNIMQLVPLITIRAGTNTDDRPYAYECDLCGAIQRVTGDFNRHQRDGCLREGFRVVRAVPEVEMIWYGIDNRGYLYVGNIIAVGKDKLRRQGGMKMPCGPNVRAAKAAKATAKAARAAAMATATATA